jgi:hypothetical protein
VEEEEGEEEEEEEEEEDPMYCTKFTRLYRPLRKT